MTDAVDVADLVELRLRMDASELRQAAIESRQSRIEKMLVEHSGEQRTTNKLLNTLADHVQRLTEKVAALVPSRPAVPKASPPKKR